MLNSLMPNERKQLNKSHWAVPLTDAIQEVGPISTRRRTEKGLLGFAVKFPHAMFSAGLCRQGRTNRGKLYCPLFSTSLNLLLRFSQFATTRKLNFRSEETKQPCSVTGIASSRGRHLKWVKQATESICIPLFGSSCSRRDADTVCSECKTSPWPNDPENHFL